jgi:hypothetical protein
LKNVGQWFRRGVTDLLTIAFRCILSLLCQRNGADLILHDELYPPNGRAKMRLNNVKWLQQSANVPEMVAPSN